MLDGDDRRQSFLEVVVRELRIILLHEVVVVRVLVDDSRQGLTETVHMHAAFRRKDIVAEGRKNQAPARQVVLNIDGEKVRELGIIDMTFPDINGIPRTLSDLKGKVVLLDFTAFSLEGSQERTLLLRELYNKYHASGFEIYQVSFDPDRHFWTQRCENLPWVCVYAEEGLDSDMLTLYRVQELPSYFLIDRNCDLQSRMETTSDIRKAIESLL